MSLQSVSFIQGLALGIEFVDAIPEDDIPNSIIVDVLIFRFIFKVGK